MGLLGDAAIAWKALRWWQRNRKEIDAMFVNWKTTLGGVAAILSALTMLIQGLATDGIAGVQWEAFFASLTAGIGLLAARDWDKTSEEQRKDTSKLGRMGPLGLLVLAVMAPSVLFGTTGCQTLMERTTPEERIAYAQTALAAAQEGYQAWLEYRDYQDKLDEVEYQRELAERHERMERLQAVLDTLIDAAQHAKADQAESGS